MRKDFFAPIFGLLLWIVIASIGRTQDGGTWELRASMPVLRQELATGVLDGKLYVLGGYDEDRSSTATVEVYDEILTAFVELEPPTHVRSNPA